MTPLIGLDDVTVFRGDRAVLDGVSMSVAPGERLALIGGNGTGKTTLLRTLVGLEKPAKGSVFAFGEMRASEKSFRDVRAKAGFLFQDPDDQLFCPTVIDDVAFGPINLGLSQPEATAIAKTTLDQLGLGPLAGRVTHRLSGGEKRLVTLAAVLAMQPEVLLLDEPTNALDDVHLARLQEILLSLKTAMVIVSHDKYFIESLATRAVLLHAGHLTPGHVHRHTHFHDDVHVHSDDDPGGDLH